MDDALVKPVALSTEDDSGLIACGLAAPRMRWRLSAEREGVLQEAYELERATDPDFTNDVVSTGRVEWIKPFDAKWPGSPLDSREVVWCRVRVWTDKGLTVWSDALRVEGSLFRDDDWIARPVSPIGNAYRQEPGPVPLLRRSFDIAGDIAQARLHVTALGVLECWINGKRVGQDLFEPGWTAYEKRLLFATYDVKDLLQDGENVLAGAVGDGWWRGNLTWMSRRAVYGGTTALMAQLEITFADGTSQTIATDEAWRGSTGELLSADFYDGCRLACEHEPVGWREPGFDQRGWERVTVLNLPSGLEQRRMPAVRVVDRYPVSARRDDAGRLMVDCGQNLTGFLRLIGMCESASTITVRHAEVLESDGSLQVQALRTAKATDTYHVGPGRFELEPSFTYHGFRHAQLQLPDGAVIEGIEVCVVASDLPEVGQFACSDDRVNKLSSNIRWSQRGNFLAIPTDCPQRDERLGWTGDIQVFAPTACLQFDSRAFLESWLVDLEHEQAPDGRVPSTVPNVIGGHEYEYGGIGWADAATLVPCALYQAYGSTAVLERQFESMRRWVDWAASRLDESKVWLGDFHLGDWLDPGAPPDRPEEATTDRDFIASAYLAFSAAKLAETSQLLGKSACHRHYRWLSAEVAAATWRHWRDTARKTQAGCAIAIMFGIVPADERMQLGEELAGLVERNSGRIATGFLGTPLVLPALTLTDQHGAAMQVLLNVEAPGWLYQVLNGATTVWERWDAILPDGSINRGSMAIEDAECMTSFNHYAYGAVGAWLYETLAGIAPDQPGYALIRFAPRPGHEIAHARATIMTPFGEAAISWEREAESWLADVIIPPGAQGCFDCPPGWTASPLRSDNRPLTHGLFGSGRHKFVLRELEGIDSRQRSFS